VVISLNSKLPKMKIVINNNRKIFAIQEEFSAMFPGLEIAFHAKPSKAGSAPSPKLVMHSSKTLQDCRAIHNEGTIEVSPFMNVSYLKKNLRDIFGLSVEIFHKGGNDTGEKHVADNFTLEEANSKPS